MTKDNLTTNASKEAESPAFLVGAVISRLFSELATKHNVKVDDLNLHISCKTLYIQKYTPNSKNEYECLEMVDLNGL
jgi:hypothetical protein